MQRMSFTHKMRDGWGLATDGKVLFGSDGTSMLYKLDPKSLEGYYSFCLRFYYCLDFFLFFVEQLCSCSHESGDCQVSR